MNLLCTVFLQDVDSICNVQPGLVMWGAGRGSISSGRPQTCVRICIWSKRSQRVWRLMFVQYLKDKQDTLTYVHRKRKILILANHNRQIVLCVGCWPIHYRPIKGVQFEFAHFVSHFIRVQIFQNSLAFYICRGQKEYFSINSVRKKGRVEPF